MARPKKLRRVGPTSQYRGFKPVGRAVSDLAVETLRLDELEALRLSDMEGLYQEAAAEQMHISRPTLSRILSTARAVVARAIINEKLLLIGEGPVVTEPRTSLPCPVHGGRQRRGRGCTCAQGDDRLQTEHSDKEVQKRW